MSGRGNIRPRVPRKKNALCEKIRCIIRENCAATSERQIKFIEKFSLEVQRKDESQSNIEPHKKFALLKNNLEVNQSKWIPPLKSCLKNTNTSTTETGIPINTKTEIQNEEQKTSSNKNTLVDNKHNLTDTYKDDDVESGEIKNEIVKRALNKFISNNVPKHEGNQSGENNKKDWKCENFLEEIAPFNEYGINKKYENNLKGTTAFNECNSQNKKTNCECGNDFKEIVVFEENTTNKNPENDCEFGDNLKETAAFKESNINNNENVDLKCESHSKGTPGFKGHSIQGDKLGYEHKNNLKDTLAFKEYSSRNKKIHCEYGNNLKVTAALKEININKNKKNDRKCENHSKRTPEFKEHNIKGHKLLCEHHNLKDTLLNKAYSSRNKKIDCEYGNTLKETAIFEDNTTNKTPKDDCEYENLREIAKLKEKNINENKNTYHRYENHNMKGDKSGNVYKNNLKDTLAFKEYSSRKRKTSYEYGNTLTEPVIFEYYNTTNEPLKDDRECGNYSNRTPKKGNNLGCEYKNNNMKDTFAFKEYSSNNKKIECENDNNLEETTVFKERVGYRKPTKHVTFKDIESDISQNTNIKKPSKEEYTNTGMLYAKLKRNVYSVSIITNTLKNLHNADQNQNEVQTKGTQRTVGPLQSCNRTEKKEGPVESEYFRPGKIHLSEPEGNQNIKCEIVTTDGNRTKLQSPSGISSTISMVNGKGDNINFDSFENELLNSDLSQIEGSIRQEYSANKKSSAVFDKNLQSLNHKEDNIKKPPVVQNRYLQDKNENSITYNSNNTDINSTTDHLIDNSINNFPISNEIQPIKGNNNAMHSSRGRNEQLTNDLHKTNNNVKDPNNTNLKGRCNVTNRNYKVDNHNIFYPNGSQPISKMPWIQRMEEDRRKLKNILENISEINDMINNAQRSICPESDSSHVTVTNQKRVSTSTTYPNKRSKVPYSTNIFKKRMDDATVSVQQNPSHDIKKPPIQRKIYDYMYVKK